MKLILAILTLLLCPSLIAPAKAQDVEVAKGHPRYRVAVRVPRNENASTRAGQIGPQINADGWGSTKTTMEFFFLTAQDADAAVVSLSRIYKEEGSTVVGPTSPRRLTGVVIERGPAKRIRHTKGIHPCGRWPKEHRKIALGVWD